MAEELMTTMQFQDDIASAEQPPMLPKKEYRMIVQKARFDALGDSGTFLMYDFVIPPAEYPADFAGVEDNPEGVVATRQILAEVRDGQGRQTKRHVWNMKKVYTALGMKPPKDGTVDTAAMNGKEVLATLGIREANGEEFYKVTGVKKLPN